MKRRIATWLLLVLFLASFCAAFAQTKTQSQKTETQTTGPVATETQEKNIKEYIELLRTNVRQQKAEIMGAVMQLDANEAAKFWPIYNDYDAELNKLNNLRVANIKDYADSYDRMTDEKADQLIQQAFAFRKQRSELLAKYYGRVKTGLSAIQAARFVQVEQQLLEIIDLQIEASLPLAAQRS